MRIEPDRGLVEDSSLRRLASTRATATRCAWPPDSRVTDVPGAAASIEPGASQPVGTSSHLRPVAQRGRVAAHVEVIEQRRAADEPELAAIEIELRATTSKPAASARHARTARGQTSTCRHRTRRAARRPRPHRS
jgi:hypothetical protein